MPEEIWDNLNLKTRRTQKSNRSPGNKKKKNMPTKQTISNLWYRYRSIHSKINCLFKKWRCFHCEKFRHKQGFSNWGNKNSGTEKESVKVLLVTRKKKNELNRKFGQVHMNQKPVKLQKGTGSDITIILEETWR